MKTALKVFLVVMLLALAIVPAARAQLIVGPPDAITGFPAFVQDTATGTLLALCNDGTPDDPLVGPCQSTALNVAGGGFVAGNINEAVFYMASAVADGGAGEVFVLSGMIEAFGNGCSTNTVLLRLRKITVAGAYTAITPWGTFGPFNLAVGDDVTLFPAEGTITNGPVKNFWTNAVPPLTIPGADGTYFGDGVSVAPLVIPAGQLPAGGANRFEIQGPPGFTSTPVTGFTVEGKIFGVAGTTPLTPGRATFSRTGANAGRLLVFADSIVGATVTATSAAGGVPAAAITMNPVAGSNTFMADVALANATTELPTQIQLSAVLAPATETIMTVNVTDTVFISKAEFNFKTNKLAIAATSSDKRTPAKGRPVLQAFTGKGVLLGTLKNGKLNVAPAIPVMPEFVEVRSAAGGSAKVATTFK